ncbi:MAG: hypothetical protein IPN86_24715 [Saprospiraceae bacterium]|nr:hypothetical protein [Saprospiraceae bacterium]
MIASFHPQYVVMGYDHKFGLNRAGDISLFESTKPRDTSM